MKPHTSPFTIACALTPIATATAQDATPAPLSIGVLVLDPGGVLTTRALEGVLARSPNVDLRSARDVRDAYEGTSGDSAATLHGDRARARDLMERAALESLLVVRARGDAMIIEVYGPDGRLLSTLSHGDHAPTPPQARALIRSAFDRAAPVTLAWREGGGSRSPRAPNTAPAEDAAPARADAPTTRDPSPPTPGPVVAAAPDPGASGGSTGGASDTTSLGASGPDAEDKWVLYIGPQTNLVEGFSESSLMYGAQIEYAKESVGGWDEDSGFAFSLSTVPPQTDTFLLRADARVLGVVFIDAAVSPEMVTGVGIALRDSPTLRELFLSFGPVIGGGLRSDLGGGTIVRGHVIGGLEISPGYAFGAFWEARAEASIVTPGGGWTLSPRIVRRASLLAVSALDERTLTRWEFTFMLGYPL